MRFDDIMEALKRLDGEVADKPNGKFINRARRWKDLFHSDPGRRSLFRNAQRPGTRRVLEAMQSIEDEAPCLVNEASIAAAELAKGRGKGGHVPE